MRIDEAKLGAIVQEVRLNVGITQRELAEKTGLTVNYISLFENGHRGISIPKLNAVADILGIPALLLTTLAADVHLEPERDADRLLRQIQSITRQAIDLYISCDR